MAASLRIFCLFVCATITAARTLKLEKIAISMTEEFKETEFATTEILTSLLNYHSNTSGGLEFDLRDCSKGTCKFCKKEIVEACFIASIEAASIKMEITINGKTFFETTITVSGEKTFCKKVDFIPAVKEVCLMLTDMNLKDMSGCVAISIKTKLVIPVKFKIGCFKIPHSESKLTGNEEFHQRNQNEATDNVLSGSLLKFVPLEKYFDNV